MVELREASSCKNARFWVLHAALAMAENKPLISALGAPEDNSHLPRKAAHQSSHQANTPTKQCTQDTREKKVNKEKGVRNGISFPGHLASQMRACHAS